MKFALGVVVGVVIALVVVDLYLTSDADRRLTAMKQAIEQKVVIGATRSEAIAALQTVGLVASNDPSFGGLAAGRSYLGYFHYLWIRQLYVKVWLDKEGKVTKLEVVPFNEGL